MCQCYYGMPAALMAACVSVAMACLSCGQAFPVVLTQMLLLLLLQMRASWD